MAGAHLAELLHLAGAGVLLPVGAARGEAARLGRVDEVGRAADFVFLDKAQHSEGSTLLDSIRLGDLPGIGMTVIDGIVRTQRSRNTPPATRIPAIAPA